MSFETERAMAEQAMLSSQEAAYPPVAARIRSALDRLGVSMRELAATLIRDPSNYWDLPGDDSELFFVVDLDELPTLASALGLSVMVLLFGEGPPSPLPLITYDDVASAIRGKLAASGLAPEQLSESVGWELQPLLDDPRSLGSFNMWGTFDVCTSVGLDWVALVDTVARGAA